MATTLRSPSRCIFRTEHRLSGTWARGHDSSYSPDYLVSTSVQVCTFFALPHSISQTLRMANAEGAVRRATDDDLQRVLELDETTPVGHPRRAMLTSRIHQGNVLIFEQRSLVLAYAVLVPRSFFGRDFVELIAVSVHERRRGIGGLLLTTAVALSSTDRIFTSTNETNSAMLGALARHGWQLSGRLEGIDEGDPELVFYKDAARSHETHLTRR